MESEAATTGAVPTVASLGLVSDCVPVGDGLGDLATGGGLSALAGEAVEAELTTSPGSPLKAVSGLLCTKRQS